MLEKCRNKNDKVSSRIDSWEKDENHIVFIALLKMTCG